MANTIKLQGRLYPSFHQDQLATPENPEYGVLYINGDKTKLFHFPWSNDIIKSILPITPPANLPEDKNEEYFEVEFFSDKEMLFKNKNHIWDRSRFANISWNFINTNLVFDESVGHSTKKGLASKPVFETNKINRQFLNKED